MPIILRTATGKPDFSDAFAKLERADEHIDHLKAEIASFLGTEFYRLWTNTDKGTGAVEIGFDSLHQPSKRLNLILGDAISNMRSALDYLAVALTGDEKAEFPTARDASSFRGEVTKGKKQLTAAGQAIINMFIDEVQPYEGGRGHALFVLNQLRNIDKHRLLLATVSLAGITIRNYRDASGNTIKSISVNAPAGQTCKAMRIGSGNFKIDPQIESSFEVQIHEPKWVARTEVISFLEATSSEVKRTLNSLQIALG